MVKTLFLFPQPADPKADDYVANSWLPWLKAQSAVRSITGSAGPLMGGRDLPYSRVIEASWESLGDVMASLESPDGQVHRQLGRDLGVIVLLYETREY